MKCIKIFQHNTLKTYAYCGTTSGLLVLEVTEPNIFREITFLEVGNINEIVFCNLESKTGIYALLAASEKGLIILDISVPSHITYAGSFNSDGYALDVAVSGNYAFVADRNNGLVIIDISDPWAPTCAGGIDTGTAAGVAISGNYAFVVGTGGLNIIDISDHSVPAYIGKFYTDGYARDVSVSGNYAFVADSNNDLVIVDCSDLEAPTYIGEVDTYNEAISVAVSGNYAFVVGGALTSLISLILSYPVFTPGALIPMAMPMM